MTTKEVGVLGVLGEIWSGERSRIVEPGVTAEEWAARYGIEAFSHPCSECGRLATTSIPFTQGTLRGLQSPRCECGNERTPYVVVRDPTHGDLLSAKATSPRKKTR